jgi:hypothetical protein
MSSSHSSRNGGDQEHYDPAQLELRYFREAPHFVQHLMSRNLADCEREICYLTLECPSIKSAANRRGGSDRTIERHRSDAIKKLGAPPNGKFKGYLLTLLGGLSD